MSQDKSEGAEWERELSEFVAEYQHGRLALSVELVERVRRYRQQAYGKGYTEGTQAVRCLTAEEAVAEFAREVVALHPIYDINDKPYVPVADIHTLAKERGIDLNTLKS